MAEQSRLDAKLFTILDHRPGRCSLASLFSLSGSCILYFVFLYLYFELLAFNMSILDHRPGRCSSPGSWSSWCANGVVNGDMEEGALVSDMKRMPWCSDDMEERPWCERKPILRLFLGSCLIIPS